MKYIIIFSTVFAVLGVILISGSLLMVPYTVREPFRVDRSKTWAEDTFELRPNSNKSYLFDSIAKNWSVFQIEINKSDALVFKIAQEYKRRVVFQNEIGPGGGGVELVRFWTPPFDSLWLFIFENPYATSVNVSVKVTEFYLKIVDYKEVIYYRPYLDQSFVYMGITTITFGLVVNSVYNIYLSRHKPESESAS